MEKMCLNIFTGVTVLIFKSLFFTLHSEPCPPTNIQASATCEQLTASVSWQQSALAVGYVAYFDNQNGHSASCVGTEADTGCMVSGLMCGAVYRVWVKALGRQYNSSDSNVTTLTTGKDKFGTNRVKVYCDVIRFIDLRITSVYNYTIKFHGSRPNSLRPIYS